MLTIDTIRDIVSKVGKKYGIKNAYLFGSYAKGTANENSDVDLVIDKGELHTYRDYFHFCDELETELGTDVDITSEDGMFPGFFELIKNDRILLYGA
ncbi:nucleotidyltransferase domain-containing protein [Candidatus Saccharibacteria bacterium]|nr:nucleotidyltransferase domain-containing protein [Candidatus Saccharibacteria bacterium]